MAEADRPLLFNQGGIQPLLASKQRQFRPLAIERVQASLFDEARPGLVRGSPRFALVLAIDARVRANHGSADEEIRMAKQHAESKPATEGVTGEISRRGHGRPDLGR